MALVLYEALVTTTGALCYDSGNKKRRGENGRIVTVAKPALTSRCPFISYDQNGHHNDDDDDDEDDDNNDDDDDNDDDNYNEGDVRIS